MITKIYLDNFYKGYCGSLVYNKTKQEELFSEFILIVLELDQDKVKQLVDRKEFKYYAIAIIRGLVYSKYSSYNKNSRSIVEAAASYNKFDSTKVSSYNYIDHDELMDEHTEEGEGEPSYLNTKDAKKLLKKVDKLLSKGVDEDVNIWYSQKIFDVYFNEYNSFRKMSKATSIPTNSIYNSIKDTKEKIKDNLGKEYERLKHDRVF